MLILILQVRELRLSIVRGETELKLGLPTLSSLLFPSITLLDTHTFFDDPFVYLKRKSNNCRLRVLSNLTEWLKQTNYYRNNITMRIEKQ